MSRSRHVNLERAETAIHGGRGRQDRRRAEVEEQIAVALAAGDQERVSELREQLDAGGTEAHE